MQLKVIYTCIDLPKECHSGLESHFTLDSKAYSMGFPLVLLSKELKSCFKITNNFESILQVLDALAQPPSSQPNTSHANCSPLYVTWTQSVSRHYSWRRYNMRSRYHTWYIIRTLPATSLALLWVHTCGLYSHSCIMVRVN